MRVDYITDKVEIPEPDPPGLPENFGKAVSVRPYRTGRRSRFESYGYIIAEANEVVEVAYYTGRHTGYVTAFFNKWEILPSPYSNRAATYTELQNKNIEVWV